MKDLAARYDLTGTDRLIEPFPEAGELIGIIVPKNADAVGVEDLRRLHNK